MKKINLLFVLLGMFAVGFMSSCDTTADGEETPLLTLSPSSDVTEIEGATVSISATAGVNPISKSNLKTLSVDADGITNDTTISFSNNTPSFTGSFDFVAPAAGQTNTVTFTLTDKAGEVTSKSIVITGTSGTISTPFGSEVNGAFFHIGGSLHGAYDLVSDATVAAAGSEASKDMKNVDMAGANFTGSWTTGTGNGTLYVKANSFDYANGSVEDATAAYAAGTGGSAMLNPLANDVYIAKLRGGSDYAVIQIVTMDAANNECACGNTGKLTFNYKKSN